MLTPGRWCWPTESPDDTIVTCLPHPPHPSYLAWESPNPSLWALPHLPLESLWLSEGRTAGLDDVESSLAN